MARACGNCVMFIKGPTPTNRTYATGHCTHPSIARIVRDDDHCIFFVRGPEHDVNASLRAFERVKAGQDKLQIKGPDVLDLDLIRRREAKENWWDPRRRDKR